MFYLLLYYLSNHNIGCPSPFDCKFSYVQLLVDFEAINKVWFMLEGKETRRGRREINWQWTYRILGRLIMRGRPSVLLLNLHFRKASENAHFVFYQLKVVKYKF